MTRAPNKTCPGLYRLLDVAALVQIGEFLQQAEFRTMNWLEPYRSCPDDAARAQLQAMLHAERKERLDPLEREAARVLTISERRGQYVLDGIARTKLNPVDLEGYKAQRDELARSLWAYINQRLLFDAVEATLHLRHYRRYGKHYQSFNVEARAASAVDVRRNAIDALIDDVQRRLDLGSGCRIEPFDLPAEGERPAAEMYILYHPNPLTSAREVTEDGERRTIYYRPPGEATIVYTPSTGVVEVRGDTRFIRRQVAESFAENALDQDLSKRPLDFREYNLSRFFDGFGLEPPDLDGFTILRCRVVKAEVSLRHLGNRLSVTTTIDEDIEDLIESQRGLRSAFRRAVAIRFIEIAVRYRLAGETAERTLDFTISDQNSCSLLSLPAEHERVLGHRLLAHWGILKELKSLTPSQSFSALAVFLEIWDGGFEEIPGSWLHERGIDEALMTAGGFLEPRGWADVDLIDGDDTGPEEAIVLAESGRARLRLADDDLVVAGTPARFRMLRVNAEWLIEHLRSVVAAALDQSHVESLGTDLHALGVLRIDDTEVPVYLARRLDDEKVRGACDTLLRARGGLGLGLVLSASRSAFGCLGANVLTPLADRLESTGEAVRLDTNSLRLAFRNSRHLARGGQAVELVWDGGESGELFIPGKEPAQISGHNRLKVVHRLVEAWKSGAPAVKTSALNHDLGGVAIRNIFGKPLWERLEGRFIRSAGYGLWALAV